MKSPVRPELTTASVVRRQATPAAVDNSASIQPARSIFISWGKSAQISGATSMALRESKTIRLKRATVVPRPFRQILYTLLMPFDISYH